jgi:sugar diacid utilization regulator
VRPEAEPGAAIVRREELEPEGVVRPGMVFDELVAISDGTLAHLVPEAIRQALGDPTVRETLQVFVEADLNVAATAKALSLHPSSLRY